MDKLLQKYPQVTSFLWKQQLFLQAALPKCGIHVYRYNYVTTCESVGLVITVRTCQSVQNQGPVTSRLPVTIFSSLGAHCLKWTLRNIIFFNLKVPCSLSQPTKGLDPVQTNKKPVETILCTYYSMKEWICQLSFLITSIIIFFLFFFFFFFGGGGGFEEFNRY